MTAKDCAADDLVSEHEASVSAGTDWKAPADNVFTQRTEG